MNPRIKRLALALLVVSVAVFSVTSVGAAERGHSTKTPLAGPWYTPRELKALNVYSNASFAQKKALLAGSDSASIAPDRGTVVLAGPRYTPRELKALIAYSKASFAQKKALLAGTEPSKIGALAGQPTRHDSWGSDARQSQSAAMPALLGEHGAGQNATPTAPPA